MPRPPAHPVRDDLYCPECGHQGMRPLDLKAESGRRRYRCVSCKMRTTSPSNSPVQILPKVKVTEIKRHKRFIVTSAVNDTGLVSRAHETLKAMADAIGACYLVVPGVYKNPDLHHQGVINNYTWPAEILPYVCNADIKLCKSLQIKGKTRIRYTAINPLAGLNHAGCITSEIYGHPQVAMEMVATAQDELPKMLHTTGTISQPNYGGSVAAQKAEFHHTIGALLVEVEGDKFWSRELLYDGYGIADLDKYYTPEGVSDGIVAAMVYGDTHKRALSPKIEKLLERVRTLLHPELEIFHDVHDHHVGSHHTAGDLMHLMRLARAGNIRVRDELMQSVRFLEKHEGAYVVDSNHNRHLNQWFNRFDPRKDAINAELYFELGELFKADMEAGGDGDLFRLFIEKYCGVPINFLNGNESFMVRDIDCSQHGDRGPNGSRGSAKSLAKSGHKTFIGHSHSPRIEKGCWQVGTSVEHMEYAQGFSSWACTHGIIYDNGKRALFTIVKGRLAPMMR